MGDYLGIGLAVTGTGAAVLAFWVQVKSYWLQREQGTGGPGRHLDPREAAQALDYVDEDPVRTIASDFIFVESHKQGVGYIQKQPIGVYLDLHSASCAPRKRAALAQSLAGYAREELGIIGRNTLIASPREGNLLVGSLVAELLRVDFLMIRTVTAPRFGYPIEGVFRPGSTAVIVDDLCMEGAFLGRCVKSLRRYGMNVSHAICLFERLDGDTRGALEDMGVTLHAKYQIDDETLKELQENVVVV